MHRSQALLLFKKCTGCKTCGHEGLRHASGGCDTCGTLRGCNPLSAQATPVGTPGGAPCGRVGSGPGACFCGCEFHARSRDRATAEAFQTCRNDLEFVAQLRGPSAFQRIGAQALAAARSAVAALPPSALDASSRLLTWPRRPDVGALADVLVRVGQRNKRRLKVSSLGESLPAQWDVRSPRHASAKLAVVSIQLGARTKRSAERGEPLFCAVVFGPARAGDEDHEAAA